VLIVADDLTGAADAAGAFAAAGHPCVVVLDGRTAAAPELATNASVVAVDTNGRLLSEEDAFLATASAVRVHPQRPVFVKIDSTLRGHVRGAITAVLSVLETRPTRVVVCPAFPARGRTVVDAHVHVDGEPITDGSLRAALSGFPSTAGLFVPTARSDEDLAGLVRNVHRPDQPDAVLWVGSAGLARHLAQRIDAPARTEPISRAPAQRIAVVVGSQHEATRRQVAALDAAFRQRMHTQVFDIDPRDDEFVAHVVTTLRKVDGLVLTGGHTARVVLDALGIASFTVGGEVEPGIPWATVAEPAISLITKAGGFGDDDSLRRAVEFLHRV
jgi:uncharacterized protein YgbK (DUF1537 family)